MFYIILAPPSEKLQAASDFNDITITQDSFGAKTKKKNATVTIRQDAI